ncbi:MAG: hypothetical protein K6B69_13680 [Lachnospiraceae bacterium]|nr:hypothetical protein [Lachnospiraceae bacterium]
MFNLSDRDAKIIMLLLIVAVIALPYVFYSKNTREDIKTQEAKNTQLEERYLQLQKMNENRQWYLDETARLDKERNNMIAKFPADVRSENYTMFLLNMEYNSQVKSLDEMQKIMDDEELQRPGMIGIDGNHTVFIDSVAYGSKDILPISEDGSDENLMGIVNTSAVTYFCYYDGLKYLIKYLNGYYDATTEDGIPDRDPLIYKSFDMAYNAESGVIEGSITLDQYAISGIVEGEERVLPPAEIWPDLDEFEIRGNEEDGVFGPLDPEALMQRIEWQMEDEEEEEDQAREQNEPAPEVQ